MRNIKIKKLTPESFAPYGTTADYLGYNEVVQFGTSFFPDLARQSLGTETIVSYSVCVCVACEHKIHIAENHDHTDELIMPLDGDALFYVAPATLDNSFPADRVEVFHIPKGTMILLKPGIWHYAPFAYGSEKVAVLCALPQRTYKNDCFVVHLEPEQQIFIELE